MRGQGWDAVRVPSGMCAASAGFCSTSAQISVKFFQEELGPVPRSQKRSLVEPGYEGWPWACLPAEIQGTCIIKSLLIN